jgi:hypothetical protein
MLSIFFDGVYAHIASGVTTSVGFTNTSVGFTNKSRVAACALAPTAASKRTDNA